MAKFERRVWEVCAKELGDLDFEEPVVIQCADLSDKELKKAILREIENVVADDWVIFSPEVRELIVTHKKMLAAIADEGLVETWKAKMEGGEKTEAVPPSDDTEAVSSSDDTEDNSNETETTSDGEDTDLEQPAEAIDTAPDEKTSTQSPSEKQPRVTRVNALVAVLKSGTPKDLGKIAEKANDKYVKSGGKNNVIEVSRLLRNAVEFLVALGYADVSKGKISLK